MEPSVREEYDAYLNKNGYKTEVLIEGGYFATTDAICEAIVVDKIGDKYLLCYKTYGINEKGKTYWKNAAAFLANNKVKDKSYNNVFFGDFKWIEFSLVSRDDFEPITSGYAQERISYKNLDKPDTPIIKENKSMMQYAKEHPLISSYSKTLGLNKKTEVEKLSAEYANKIRKKGTPEHIQFCNSGKQMFEEFMKETGRETEFKKIVGEETERLEQFIPKVIPKAIQQSSGTGLAEVGASATKSVSVMGGTSKKHKRYRNKTKKNKTKKMSERI